LSMEFRINKRSELPIYQQLKEQIKFYLISGALQPGTRVPSPKELGEYLQINRNTVIAAYKELEREGIIMSRCGQGTYVSEDLSTLPDVRRKQNLLALGREMLDRTRELGFQPEDLFTVVFNQTVLGLNPSEFHQGGAKPRVVVVECNQPDADYFADTFRAKLGIEAKAYVLDDLPGKLEEEFVKNADFAITNISHLEDVKAILEPLNLNVLAVMAAPQMELFMNIRALPAGTRIALVCLCKDWSARMKRGFDNAGIKHLDVKNFGLEDPEELRQVMREVDYIYASRVAIAEVRKMAPPDVEIREYFNEVDEAGLDMIRHYLTELNDK
jgi:GntR family transcriptional regulator